MKKKFRKLLSEKCKDMGLTDKALDDLVEIGAEGLADDASDEDIAAKVDSLVPYAKAMQGEITRKTQRPKPQSKKPQSNDEGEDEGGNDDEAPEWFKPFGGLIIVFALFRIFLVKLIVLGLFRVILILIGRCEFYLPIIALFLHSDLFLQFGDFDHH